MATESFVAQTAPLRGTVQVPGSKSISNRALVCAALAPGETHLRGIASGDDTRKMIEGLRTLGASLIMAGGNSERELRVTGPIAHTDTAALTVDAGLAGTTSRFLTAVAALREGPTTITGAPGLRARPMGELHRILRHIGAVIEGEHAGLLPVIVRSGGLQLAASMSVPMRHELSVRGDVSSQFISALMLIAPCIGGLRVRLDGPVVSSGYLEMTGTVMCEFGADVSVSATVIEIGDKPYHAARMVVDADWSSASYPFAAVAIVGGEVRVPNLCSNGSQPEEAFLDVLAQMGCKADVGSGGVLVHRGPASTLRGVDVDMSAISDLVPTVAAIAACASSPTRIRGVGFIRAKESDRLGDLAHELAACGAGVVVHDDGLTIEPRELRAATLQPHDDHRLAMSLSLLGLRTAGIAVTDADVVDKSWPEFWSAMRAGFNLTRDSRA